MEFMTTKQSKKPSLFRHEIVAQQTLQRARLLRSMLGLTDSALDQPLWDDYSIRRLLPHIALWDGYETERLSLIRDGRIDELGWMPVDERNAAWHAAYAETSVDAGVAMLQKERASFRNVLETVPDELLKSTLMLNDDFALPVMSCVSNSIEHDEHHTNDIQAWRESNGLARWQNGQQSILLAALKASRRALQAMRALIVSAETKKKGPLLIEGWSLKATLAHLGGWEKNVALSLQAGSDQRPDQDSDSLNAEFVKSAENKSLEQVWNEYETARRAVETFVRQRSTTDLYKAFPNRRDDINTFYLWICLHVAHDVDHLNEMHSAHLMYTRLR